jgi:uncharacterized protein YciI
MTEPRQWFALLHTAGPAVLEGQRVFEHPDIGEHYAFLRRLAADGVLIAAGPLTDADGDGLTVIEAGSLAEARRLAEQQDGSVRAGVLAVTVRPWQVRMAPIADR